MIEKKKNIKDRIILIFVIAAVFTVAFGSFAIYLKAIRTGIYEANARQLEEMYEIAADHFIELSRGNFKHLNTIETVFDMVGNTSRYDEFIANTKEKWGYSYFYFMDRDGNTMTTKGDRGWFDLGDAYQEAIRDDRNIMRRVAQTGKEDIALYIHPTKPGSYLGFDYCVIAISYDRDALVDSVHVASYEGNAETSIVGSDGRIVITDSDITARNIYSVIHEDTVFEYSSFEEMKNSIGEEGNCNAVIAIDGKNYYIALVDMGFYDWNMLGMVPEEIVNGSMTKVQKLTMFFVGGILMFLAFILVGTILWKSERNVREKDIQLKYREQLFNILSSQTDQVFLMFVPGVRGLEYISPNVERVMGVSAETARRDFFSIRPDLSTEEKLEYIQKINSLPEGTPEYLEWSRIDPATGETQWFSETLLLVGIDGTDKVVVVISDVSKDVEGKQRLKEALDIAEAANRAKSSFLNNMSHDIRTPMNAIVGLCVLLEKDAADPEKVREHTKKITASSNHMLGLINDVLDMSKIESGKTTLNIEEFALNKWIEELNILIRPQMKAKQQKFHIHVSDIVHESVMGDKLRLNQIMLNILSNATKYTPAGGKIDFFIREVEQTSTRVVKYQFVVKDTGIGMNSDYLNVIFDPFTREVNTKVNKIQGTGLGMAITKHLVDLMGGTVRVASTLGEGSTFTVEISLRIIEQDVDRQFWENHGISRTLIVDDESQVCSSIMAALSGTGVDAQYATDGPTAVVLAQNAHLRHRDFDVILIDWKMPGMDGVETARQIRKRISEDIPIFILTAYDFEEIKEEAREAGITGFLTKPFFVTNFMEIIDNLEEGKEEEGEEEQKPNYLEGMHFLVAEDNGLNSEILLELLDMFHATAVVCENGKVAVERFLDSTEGEFDAILMDVQMPVMNGYEASRTIRSSGHFLAEKIPIIAMTANAFDEDVRDALAAGMDAHVAKPIDMDQLQQGIRQAVQKRKAS